MAPPSRRSRTELPEPLAGLISEHVAALEAQGLAGSVPVSGQDGDHAALNRVALGTQTVSVWKDARDLGRRDPVIAMPALAVDADQLARREPVCGNGLLDAGEFGKVDDLDSITWERTDKAGALKRAVK